MFVFGTIPSNPAWWTDDQATLLDSKNLYKWLVLRGWGLTLYESDDRQRDPKYFKSMPIWRSQRPGFEA